MISPIWSIIILTAIATTMVSYLLIGFSNPGIVVNKIDSSNGNQLNQKICE
jgi:outer membrane protein assembly factor BamE (lipoprotein component of BamABCDE complex)